MGKEPGTADKAPSEKEGFLAEKALVFVRGSLYKTTGSKKPGKAPKAKGKCRS